ncbi:lysophospholipid acyltransferase family protein [Rhodohalobacter sp. SW132]|uniref:lysophospholipid acyltransferase family protein n=1 Tax=Rhodohalobacter sp. SW132 TaxID=2293433 RepID=UPI0013148F52|nr:lysophospholipid acyltransferase family protein [Rhodohalobacter sp. SW132]
MSKTPDHNESLPFIPAQESAFFIQIFDWYCRWLFWRRFDSVSIHSDYKPADGAKTIYFLNHNSWWDGLIPFLLNQRCYRQNARGMMEDKQLHQYPFFRKLGVFSINLGSPRSSMQSLRYALESMERPNASLYIYPQGKIVPFGTENIEFRKGIGWLAKKLPGTDLVPIGIYIHTKKSDRPRLEIKAGSAVNVDRNLPSEQINAVLESKLSHLLKELYQD